MKRLVLVASLFVISCSHIDKEKKDSEICEENKNLVCLTGTLCDYDVKKGCKVCRCDCIDGRCDKENMVTNPNLPKNVEPLH